MSQDYETIVVVKDLENLKTLIRKLSEVQGMNANYDGVLNRHEVEKSLERVDYKVPQNSYALVIKTKDKPSSEAIDNFIRQYTTLTGHDITITRGRSISALIAVGTALIAAVKDATSNTTKGTDPYGKQVLSAVSTGLAVFSAGMAAVSLIPNPITPAFSAVSGAMSLGVAVAKDAVY